MEQSEQEYAKSSFNNVAHHYDQIQFFKNSAQHVAKLIEEHQADKTNKLQNQLQILDVACGTGNVVLECAQLLKNAQFDAIDISEGMIEKARVNAKHLKLNNTCFFIEDVTKYKFSKQYDVITCSYALFFLPDAHRVLAKLNQQLNPHGLIIFTSFHKNAFTPTNTIILKLLKEHGSPSAIAYDANGWKNLQSISDIEKLCKLAQVSKPKIIEQQIRYYLNLDQWWQLLNNTGYKGMLMELDPLNYDKLKGEFYQKFKEYSNHNGEVELIADSYFCMVEPNI